MKKVIVCLLCAALLLGLCGCSQQPQKPVVTLIVKTPTLTMNSVANPEVASAEQFLSLAAKRFCESYSSADVTIRVEVFDYLDENEAVLGSYGSQNAMDILYEGYFNMASYISSGHVVPLDDIISEEIRSDISETTWLQSMKNGKTYMMPYLSMQNVIICNKDLFAQCGLEEYLTDEPAIQHWSIQEWEYILDTLAEKLPDGCFPMMMYACSNQGDTHIMSLLRAFGGEFFAEDGTFCFDDPKVVQGLRWIQGGLSRGWYPPHPENLEIADNQQLFSDDRLAIYLFNNANYILYDDVEGRYGFANFPGDIATSFVTGFQVFDNGDPLRIQIAKDFLKFIYEDEALMDISAGNIPESKRVAEKFQDQIVMLPLFISNVDHVIDFLHATPNWQGRSDSVRSVFWPHIHDLLLGNITPEDCAAALNRDCNAAIQVETVYHD